MMYQLKCVILVFCASMALSAPVLSAEYVITTVESQSNQSLVNAARRNLLCKEAFTEDSSSVTRARLQRTASYYMEPDGTIDRTRRGVQATEISMDGFEQFSLFMVNRLFYDWKASNRATDEGLTKIFDLHRRLSQHRLKMISVDDSDAARQMLRVTGKQVVSNPHGIAPERFSAIRIYDSSPVMKSYGLRYTPPKVSDLDTVEIAERVFADFNLEKALAVNGRKRHEYTWSLGLVDVSGKQDGALQTLVAQVADLLDLHYNNRDYLNFGHTDSIRSDEVDIVFYGSKIIKRYYKRLFGFDPLKDKDGNDLFVTKGGEDFYIFHMKGSDFIRKTYDYNFVVPLYGNDGGLRREQSLRELAGKTMHEYSKGYRTEDFAPKNFLELAHMLKPIVQTFIKYSQRQPVSEQDLVAHAAQFLLLRRNLPDDIFHEKNDALIRQGLEVLNFMPGTPQGSSDIESAAHFGPLMLLDLFLRDPVGYIINFTNIAE